MPSKTTSIVRKTTSTITTSPTPDEATSLVPIREALTPIPEQDIATLMNSNARKTNGNGSTDDDLVVERSYSYEEVTREVDSPIAPKRWGLSAAAISFMNPMIGQEKMLTNGSTSIIKRETEKKIDRDTKSKSLVITTKTARIEKKEEDDEDAGWRRFLHEVKSLSDSDDNRGFDLVSAESRLTEIQEGTRPDSVSWTKTSTRTYEYKTLA